MVILEVRFDRSKMANLRSIIRTLSFLMVSIKISNAIYEDQVGKFDWKRSFIGKVKYARFVNTNLFVVTEENVVASLSLKSGQILWRQVMEGPADQQPQLLHVDSDVINVIGGKNSFSVRGWDPSTGSLQWEWATSIERNADMLWFVNEDRLIHVILVPGSHIEVTHYNIRTGEVQRNTRKLSVPWVGDLQSCVCTRPYFVCTFNGHLFWVDINSDLSEKHSHPLQTLVNDFDYGNVKIQVFESTEPTVLLVVNNNVRVVQIDGGSVKALAYNLSPHAFFVDNVILLLEPNTENPEKLIRVRALDFLSGEEKSSVEVDYPLGVGGPYILSGQCRGVMCDILLLSTDNALTLVHIPEGKTVWTREEALSNIVAVEFFELPASELEVSIEDEFTTTSDVINMLSHRLSTQAKQLYNLLLGSQLVGGSSLVRDNFGLHKIIVVATSIGKLFGIDTLTGSIVWTYRLPNVKPFGDKTLLLLVQRTARYAPLPAQCVLFAEDANSGAAIVFRFDPISGSSLRGLERLGYKVKQALLLPYEDDKHLKPVLVLINDNSVHVYPEDGRAIVQKHCATVFMYIVDPFQMHGYKLSPDLSISEVWNLNLAASEVVALSTRPIMERVHSQGRVLPDRSVYYKYVNPNLIAVATLSEDPVHKHVVSVFLIDGVTGLIIYSVAHKKAKGPVHLVHSENWLVYTFFNERFRRYEVVAAEMYEGHIQSNSTAFSSFGVSLLPEVKTQSYILPAHPVSLTVTLTERGITNKFLLVGLSSGAVMEVPWMLLQPRFHDVPCGPEEMCIPYMPEIVLHPEATVNYNQSVERIKDIQVAPARLESTSHVLVHGLDLFYTRVAPSKTFDVLKEDFDHKLIVLVLCGLIMASYITKYLASKKVLRQAWK